MLALVRDGGKQGVTIVEAVGETMVRLEVRELSGFKSLWLHSDGICCYDRIPDRLLDLGCCGYCIPQVLPALMIQMYQAPRLLTIGSLTTWARPGRCNDTPAGCRLAMQFMAVLSRSLLRTLIVKVPNLAARAYVDDIVCHSGESERISEEFATAHEIYRQWVQALALLLKAELVPGKVWWACRGAGLCKFGYAVVSEVQDLGVDLCLCGAGRRSTHHTRMQQAFAKCHRLQRSSGFTQVQLQLGVRLIILGKDLWASEPCPPSWSVMTELGQQVARVICKTLMGRNLELAFGILDSCYDPRAHPTLYHCFLA